MFRFENPEYLYLFIAIPLLVLLYIYLAVRKHKDVKRLGNIKMLKRMMPELSLKRSHYKFGILILAFCIGIVMAARPQFGSKVETIDKKGIELVIAIDVSNSMMAEDVSPNRLAKAKKILTRIIDDRKQDQVALIVFAGEAFVQMPLTSDSQSAKLFLNSIDPSLVPVQGTAIGDAIDLGVKCFSSKKDVDKAMILITDGEDHEGNAVEIVQKAAAKGITINVVGIGSTKGASIPDMKSERQYKTDNTGNLVITKLNEDIAKEVAKAGKGLYVQADNGNGALRALQDALNKLQTKNTQSLTYSEYDEKFPVFAWILLGLLILEVLIFDKKNRLFKNIKVFK